MSELFLQFSVISLNFFAINFVLCVVLECEDSVRSGFESSFIPSFATDSSPAPFLVLWTSKVQLKTGIVFVPMSHREPLPDSLLSSSWERPLPFCVPDGSVGPKSWEAPMITHYRERALCTREVSEEKEALVGKAFMNTLDKVFHPGR